MGRIKGLRWRGDQGQRGETEGQAEGRPGVRKRGGRERDGGESGMG